MKSQKDQQKKMTIGFVVDWLNTGYQTALFSGVIEIANENSINVIGFPAGSYKTNYVWEKGKNLLFDFITPENIDGLILVPSTLQRLSGKAEFDGFIFEKYGNIPMVCISESIEGIPSIFIDNISAQKKLLSHLTQVHGYKRLAYVIGIQGSFDADERFKAYKEFLKENEIPFDPSIVVQGTFSYDSGKEAVKELLDIRRVEFDVIITGNDLMAKGVIDGLADRGILVPRDMSVVGFDDIDSSMSILSLTTIRQSFSDLGRFAADTIVKKIKGEPVEEICLLPLDLVIRESCGCGALKFKSKPIQGSKDGDEDIERQFSNNKKEIILTISKYISRNDTIARETCLEIASNIIDIFIVTSKLMNADEFFQKWDSIIQDDAYLFSSSDLEGIISIIYEHISRFTLDDVSVKFFQAIFKKLMVKIHKAVLISETNKSLFTDINFNFLVFNGNSLIDSFLDLKNESKDMTDVLMALGINECYISTFVDPQNPFYSSKLIYSNNKTGVTNSNHYRMPFKTANLLPDEFLLTRDQNHTWCIHTLYYNSDFIGFIIFGLKEINNTVGISMQFITEKLSSTIRLLMLIDNIKAQAQKSEEQVIERTADLKNVNKSLENKIEEKRKVEEKLRDALTELGSYNHLLKELSFKDELTGLYNRRGFLTLGVQQYNLLKGVCKGFVVIYGDLDGLKQINDRFGHGEGDIAINEAARLLKIACRPKDIVARMGGDEFTILACDISKAEVNIVIERIRKNFFDFNETSKLPYKVSISIGIKFIESKQIISLESVLNDADEMLYVEKQQKKLNNDLNTI
ncbi:MAG: diguanylate cyclase [Clostridiaceae bacterium]|nr:diguanylate cyclase [Clostridiaceae bacterium]